MVSAVTLSADHDVSVEVVFVYTIRLPLAEIVANAGIVPGRVTGSLATALLGGVVVVEVVVVVATGFTVVVVDGTVVVDDFTVVVVVEVVVVVVVVVGVAVVVALPLKRAGLIGTNGIGSSLDQPRGTTSTLSLEVR